MKHIAIPTGSVFGRLTVIEQLPYRHGEWIRYVCRCSCGNTKIVKAYLLRNGHVKSCGCIRKEKPNRIIHGLSKTREFRIWCEIKKRCSTKSYKSYKYYGGKGITFCDRWKTFENFLKDMGKCPAGYSIDRIDSNKDYEPNNCRWASIITQARNRSNNHNISYKGEIHCLSEWAEITRIPAQTIKQRLRRGWSVEDALTKEVKK